MKDFFRDTKFKIFLLIAVFLIGLMIRTAVNGGFASFSADTVNFVAVPFQKASAGVTGFFSGMVGNIVDFSSMKAENAKLKKQISSLQSQMVNYNDMLRENQELESMYGLHKENPDFKMKPATVISHDPGQWISAFTIDQGSLNGIVKDDVVVTSDGDLLGKVTMVYANSAVVSTILDPSIQVGVIVSETGDAGQTGGDLELLPKGEFRTGYIAKGSAVSPGNIIVTSGKTGVYPKNLKVGTVTDIGTEETGMALYAVCRPMISMSDVKKVVVLTDFNGKDAGDDLKGGSK